MANVPREVVEERAYMIWREAGCPEGSGLQHWLQAEQELGVIPSPSADDPFVTLHELAVQAKEADAGAAGDDSQPGDPLPSDEPLARSVERAVPPAERLPHAADENPISEQVEEAGREGVPRHGNSTLQGGDEVSP
jgi:hypothetical protein